MYLLHFKTPFALFVGTDQFRCQVLSGWAVNVPRRVSKSDASP